jgi:hypothetical protein
MGEEKKKRRNSDKERVKRRVRRQLLKAGLYVAPAIISLAVPQRPAYAATPLVPDELEPEVPAAPPVGGKEPKAEDVFFYKPKTREIPKVRQPERRKLPIQERKWQKPESERWRIFPEEGKKGKIKTKKKFPFDL